MTAATATPPPPRVVTRSAAVNIHLHIARQLRQAAAALGSEPAPTLPALCAVAHGGAR